jgi:hypothetical protein
LLSSSMVRAHPSSKPKLHDIARLIFDFRGRAEAAILSASFTAPVLGVRMSEARFASSTWRLLRGHAAIGVARSRLESASIATHWRRPSSENWTETRSPRFQLIRLDLHVVTAVPNISEDSGRRHGRRSHTACPMEDAAGRQNGSSKGGHPQERPGGI